MEEANFLDLVKFLWNREKCMKRKGIILVIVQIVIAVIFSIGQWNQQLEQYTIDGSMLTSTIGTKLSNGYVISDLDSNDLPKEEWDNGRNAFWFTKGTLPFVKRGSYEVTIQYCTDRKRNTVEVQQWGLPPQLLLADVLELSPKLNQMTTTIWLECGIENLEIRSFYNGKGSLEIQSIDLVGTRDKAGQDLLRIIGLFFIIDFLLWIRSYWKKYPPTTAEGKQRRWSVIVLGATILLLCLPLTSKTLIHANMQDLDYHLARIVGMKSALEEGQFPIRIHSSLNYGFGYASPMFYPELFLYPSAILHTIGLPLMQSYQVFIVIMNVMTVFIAYWCMKRMFQSWSIGLLGTVIYSLSYYRLLNMYLRAAVGETMAMTFFPLIVYGLYRIYMMDTKEKSYRSVWIVPALGYAGLIQSHLISGEMVGLFTLIVCIIFLQSTLEPKRFWALCKVVIAAVIVNLWFLVPMTQGMTPMGVFLYVMGKDTQWIQPEGLNLSDLFQLFFVMDSNGKTNQLQLGAVAVVIFATFIIIACTWSKKEKNTPYYRLAKWFFGLGTLALIFILKDFPWDFIRELGFIGQVLTKFRLPTRYFSLVTVFFSFLGCCLVILLIKKYPKWRKTIMTTSALFVVLCAFQFMNTLQTERGSIRPLSGANQITADWKNIGWGGEYLPNPLDHPDSLDPSIDWAGQEGVTSYEKSGTKIVLHASNPSAQSVTVQMPLIYYLGYAAQTSDGQDIPVYSGEKGILAVDIPAGYEGDIGIWHRGFWYWDAAAAVSAAAWIVFIGIIWYERRRGSKRTKKTVTPHVHTHK